MPPSAFGPLGILQWGAPVGSTQVSARLRASLEESEARSSAPIAIVGMSCRMPGSGESLEGFWDLLREGRCGVAKHPADRWKPDRTSPQWAGLLERIDDPGLLELLRAVLLPDVQVSVLQ